VLRHQGCPGIAQVAVAAVVALRPHPQSLDARHKLLSDKQ
jgi:hypothetical protein